MPDFRVIDGGGPDKEQREKELQELQKQRQREWIETQFSWELRDTAANMLRIIRGAGKPYELLRQLQKTLEAAIRFQEAHGHFPDVASYLSFESEYQKTLDRIHRGELNRSYMSDRWEDDTFARMIAEHGIICGALQLVASDLIGQRTQRAAGHSELHKGVHELERIREERIKKERAAARAARPMTKKPLRRRGKRTVAKKADVPKIEL
jgi:hypothetical protein